MNASLVSRTRGSWGFSTETRNTEADQLPRLVIYRRTQKTGSTSMATALLRALGPLGYVPIRKSQDGYARLFSNLHNPSGRPVFIFGHNSFTRNLTSHTHVIILDTIRNGYEQMTSYCRYRRKRKSCDRQVADCLANDRSALSQRFYRWANRESEDVETFIDIPLSSEHPALSTTALRTVFPDAVLHVDHFRDVNSACPEVAEIRRVYDEHYQELEDQVETLSIRLLTLAGYPYRFVRGNSQSMSIAQMLNLAESMEKHKYDLRPPRKSEANSLDILLASADNGAWNFQNGKWEIAPIKKMNAYENRIQEQLEQEQEEEN